jgi:hypothetical protein
LGEGEKSFLISFKEKSIFVDDDEKEDNNARNE